VCLNPNQKEQNDALSVRVMEGKMTDRGDEPDVLIIDRLPLRSLNLINILSHLLRSDACGQFRLILHTPDEIDQCIDPDKNYEMLIYNVGSASISDPETSQRLKALTTLAPDVPLVIVSDSECRGEIISALKVGAQGFLYAGTNIALALQAFWLMLKDRSHDPSAMRPKWIEQTSRAVDCNPVSSCTMGGGDGAVEDLEDSGSTNRNTTMRQKAVLELLSRGSPNKVIARRLGMSQGAVKFHVREIMRKFGVTNRAEVAAVCAMQA
jgi:two-component system, NarL family, nitrate/nitrite response regulator NarL